MADVVGGYGDAGCWWCVKFVEVECCVGGFDLVGASSLGEGCLDGGWVGGGCGVCLGWHCGGGSGESGEDEVAAAGAGVDVCLAGLAGVGLGALLMFDPFGGAWWWCWELVEEVGLFFGGFSCHGGSFGVRGKVVKPGIWACRRVFGFTTFTRLYMHGCNGRVRARCVCYLLAKVVNVVKPICGLTWEYPGFTRAKSCEALVNVVKPGCLPNIGILELQAAVQSGPAVHLRGCVSTDQHTVHLQLGGERPTLDRFQPLFRTPHPVGLA